MVGTPQRTQQCRNVMCAMMSAKLFHTDIIGVDCVGQCDAVVPPTYRQAA